MLSRAAAKHLTQSPSFFGALRLRMTEQKYA